MSIFSWVSRVPTKLITGVVAMHAALLCLFFAGVALSSKSAVGQAATHENSGPPAKPVVVPVAYDVVSVRPHKAGDPMGSYWRSSASGFSASVQVRSLIMSGYSVIMPNQLSGLPQWAETEEFDVQAKLDPENVEALGKLQGDSRSKQMMLLMQALLADRFKMKAHVEVKELPVYNLVIAKGGLKMKQADAGPSTGYSMRLGSITGKSVPIVALIGSLSHPAGRLIIDKTGLTGNYQVDLTWAWQDDPNAVGPSIFTALQEQLGLKLEPAKAPLDVVVIDHLERPSEN